MYPRNRYDSTRSGITIIRKIAQNILPAPKTQEFLDGVSMDTGYSNTVSAGGYMYTILLVGYYTPNRYLYGLKLLLVNFIIQALKAFDHGTGYKWTNKFYMGTD